jgi:hypothetical protein
MQREPIDVERLVQWALADQAAEAGGSLAGEYGWLAASGSNAASVATFAALGVRVDGGRHKAAGGARVHSDALDVVGVIYTLPPLMRDLVRRHGRSCTRPDCWPEARPTLGPVLDDNDRPAVSPGWDHWRNPLPRYCPIGWAVTADEINAVRARYSAWHDGLCRIAGYYQGNPGRLARWSVRGPLAPGRPADPWTWPAIEPRLVVPDLALPDLAARARREIHASNRPMTPVSET